MLREAWEHSQNGRRFLAVFDLDSTLYDLTLRVSTIVDEFVALPSTRATFPNECAAVTRVKVEPADWGLEKPFQRAGLASDTPFFKSLHEYWVKCFFSDAYMLHDEPLSGAVDYVQELHQIGAHIMYLSGRDIPRMGRGTQESLRLHHFPLVHPTARLVLKPHAELDDAEFKLEVMQEADDEYDRIWLFENEPVNLNLIARECPDVDLVFIESTHSGREQLRAPLATIRHFEVDLAEFRRRR